MFFRYIIKIFHYVKIFVVVVLLLRTFIIEPGVVNGRSMEKTFMDADFFVVNKISLFLRKPRRGDVVQAKGKDDERVIIKRVIGLPGEQIYLDKTGVYIFGVDGNKTLLNEPYLQTNIKTKSANGKPTLFVSIPKHSYFLLGDNRAMSGDSRVFGAFHRSEIYGVVRNIPFLNKKT